jgi:hypothetical protein
MDMVKRGTWMDVILGIRGWRPEIRVHDKWSEIKL